VIDCRVLVISSLLECGVIMRQFPLVYHLVFVLRIGFRYLLIYCDEGEILIEYIARYVPVAVVKNVFMKHDKKL
jgi:hypothetical protein